MSEKKIVEAEGKIEVLLRRVEKVVKVKGFVSVVGLIVSFGLAEGRSARFYTRFIKVKELPSWVSSSASGSPWAARRGRLGEVPHEVLVH